MPQMTVLEILNRTKVFFEKKGIPDARLDAEYIISHGLGMKSRMDIYLNFESSPRKPRTVAAYYRRYKFPRIHHQVRSAGTNPAP